MLFLLLLLHPGHATYTEIDWNDKTSRVEVAMRLDAVDEETLLRSLSKKHDCKIADVSDKMRLAYLVDHFRLEPSDPRAKSASIAKRYRWVGRELKKAEAWWYFEVESADGKPPSRLSHSVLWDIDDRFVHTIRCLDGDKPLTTTVHKDRPEAVVERDPVPAH